MAEKKDPGGKERSDVGTADLGTPNPEPQRKLAEDLPEKDDVQKAVKEGIRAESGQKEAQAKVKVVKASPDSPDTPSGHALLEVASISNDTERGEEYLREKTAKRWGYVPAKSS